jgi:hypothetical protein
MTIYSTVVFIHVVSAMALFIALAAEGAILFRIRTAQSLGQVRFFIRAVQRLRIIAIPSFLGILVGGLYLASKWGAGTFWIPFAFGATVLIMLIGGLVTGRRIARMKKVLQVLKMISQSKRYRLSRKTPHFCCPMDCALEWALELYS